MKKIEQEMGAIFDSEYILVDKNDAPIVEQEQGLAVVKAHDTHETNELKDKV
ncbi:hypothetical protein [Parashewanella curva]|uniref:hypothetical protein n=1 Tax=Parashewanella curva TaxID=2338552 RepID=UPI00140459C4|nr:hypothetical protein [Parashewanella curva]